MKFSNMDFVSVTVRLTNFCDFKCSYCHPTVNDGSHPRLSEADKILNFISFLKKTTNNKIIVEMMGGEPTTSTIFRPLVEQLLLMENVYVEIMSNGARSLHYWDSLTLTNKVYLTLSYHFEFCDTEHFIKTVMSLKDRCNLSVALQFKNDDLCITKNEKILMALLSTNNLEIYVKMLRTSIRNSDFFILDEVQQERIKKIKKIITEYRKTATSSVIMPNDAIINGGHIKSQNITNLNFYGWKCLAGKNRFVIDSDGSIYKCSYRSGGAVGNITNLEIFKILEDEKAYICKYNGNCICKTDLIIEKSQITKF